MSNKDEYYRQCTFKKKTRENYYKVYTAWIPEKYAIFGKILQLKFDDNRVEDGWKVTMVGGREKLKNLEERKRDYLKQRKVSDV